MEAKSKEYLKKRREIIEIIKTVECSCETDECYHTLSPDFYECILQAELILQKFGINKTEYLKENETITSILG